MPHLYNINVGFKGVFISATWYSDDYKIILIFKSVCAVTEAG